jgi:hypothetical protein
MLDQAQQMGLRELVVVVDSCYSGGFIRKASSHPAGTERIVIASTTDDRLAQYGGGRSANFSFTNLFLSQLLKGANVQEAYLEAQSTIQSLQVPRSAPQSPLLEDTGDGRTTGRDGAKARTYVLGKAAPFGALPPELLTVSADMQFPAPQGVPVEATVGFGRVDGVEAVVTWSDQYYADGSPINELTVLPLNRQGTSTRWTATLPASAFPGNGLYTVVFNAYRKDPLAGEIRYTSNTIVQRIAVGEAAAVAVQLMLLAPSSLLNDRNGDGIVDAADLL